MARFAGVVSFSVGVGAELGSVLGSHTRFGGDMMERQFAMYNELPLGEDALRSAGWTKHEQSDCDPALGFAWTEDASGPTRAKPLLLYTTAAGQPAGIGTLFVGEGALPERQQRWATQDPLVPAQVDGSYAQIDVAFRSGEVLCSGEQEPEAVGSVLIVNPKGESKSIPLTEEGSQLDGWYRGSCFDGMGWHRLLDTRVGRNRISWQAENLFPVVPMYHPDGQINAIFFASNIPQVDLPEGNNNGWEATPLDNDAMCFNTCDQACTFQGLKDKWNTMHIYFRNHLEVTCEQGLDCRLPAEFQARGACCSEYSQEIGV